MVEIIGNVVTNAWQCEQEHGEVLIFNNAFNVISCTDNFPSGSYFS